MVELMKFWVYPTEVEYCIQEGVSLDNCEPEPARADNHTPMLVVDAEIYILYST